MISKVHTWKMTEEERLDYIKKHPIKYLKNEKDSSVPNKNKKK
ncbi:hypothetical protein [Bacillus sp. AFS040349]|nr:hypothetical protein [Bacillus sp. AFS040349]